MQRTPGTQPPSNRFNPFHVHPLCVCRERDPCAVPTQVRKDAKSLRKTEARLTQANESLEARLRDAIERIQMPPPPPPPIDPPPIEFVKSYTDDVVDREQRLARKV